MATCVSLEDKPQGRPGADGCLPAGRFPQRIAVLSAPAPLSAAIAPLLAEMETLNLQIAAAAVRLARHAADDPVVRRLETGPNIGPITALSFVATLDRVERFRGPHPAATYLGLVPGEYRSGELSRRGIEANRSICRGSPGVRT